MANKRDKKRKREKQRLCQAMGKQQADIALVMEDGTRKVFSAEEWHDKVPNKVVLSGKNFYLSEVWLKLRYKVLAKNGGRCMLCLQAGLVCVSYLFEWGEGSDGP